ncbi:MAG: hypothetical protein KME42_25275 [Tildeniella nuda ZEHNDER 1965/U140]|nr:hypothetical protein [Tildeniella nuda ZEHNDER 1965/U140]
MAPAIRQCQLRAGAPPSHGERQNKGRLTLECAETWSFVGNKGNKQWRWLTLNRRTREIVGVQLGDRSQEGAQALWSSLPAVCRQCALCYTDFWQADRAVFPRQRHRSVSQERGHMCSF